MASRSSEKWNVVESRTALLVNRLFRARNHLWQNDQKIVAKHNLTWSQFSSLHSLRMAMPDYVLSPTDICTAVQVSSGGLTKMLLVLESEKLITRIDNRADGRSRYVKLTLLGKKKVEAVVEQLVETNTHLLDRVLTRQESAQLNSLLLKLSTGLDDMV